MNGLAPHSPVGVSHQEGSLGCGGPLEERGVPAQGRSSAGKGSPTTADAEGQRGFLSHDTGAVGASAPEQ